MTVIVLEEANRALQDLEADRVNGSGVMVVHRERSSSAFVGRPKRDEGK